MSNSIHVQLADAIVTEFNAQTRSWSGSLTAFRSWTPWYKTPAEIEELAQYPKVAVVPLTTENRWISRSQHEWIFTIGIDVQRAFDLTDQITPARIDLLDKQCQDVHDFFNDAHSLMGNFVVLNAARSDVHSLPLLHSNSIWETLIVVSVKGFR